MILYNIYIWFSATYYILHVVNNILHIIDIYILYIIHYVRFTWYAIYIYVIYYINISASYTVSLIFFRNIICVFIFPYIWKLIYDIWYYIYICVYIHHIMWYHILSCHIIQNLIISYPFISYHIMSFCITHTHIYITCTIYHVHYTIYNKYQLPYCIPTKDLNIYAGLGAGNDRWKSCPRWKRHPRLMPEAKPFFLAV